MNIRDERGRYSKTHGESKTRLHIIWAGMKQRCHCPGASNYKNYGQRGISVCDEWRNDYLAFRDWALANGYEDGLTLDRIRVNENYSPDNCRWSSAKEQANNKRSNVFITHDGVTLTERQWAERIGISYNTLSTRIKTRGWSVERALTTPVKHKKRGVASV